MGNAALSSRALGSAEALHTAERSAVKALVVARRRGAALIIPRIANAALALVHPSSTHTNVVGTGLRSTGSVGSRIVGDSGASHASLRAVAHRGCGTCALCAVR